MKAVFVLLLSLAVVFVASGADEECPWKWKLRVFLWGISDNNARRIKNTDEASCKKACEDETAFECRSIDFNTRFKYCFLQKVGRADVSPSEWASWPRYIYNERARSCPGCNMVWDVLSLPGYAIEGLDDRIIDNISEEECRQACEDQTDFNCWSVDYETQGGICHINPVRRADVHRELFVPKPGYLYSERKDKCTGCKLQWTSDVKAYAIEGYDESTIEGLTAEACKSACVNETQFQCRSVDYNRESKQCNLASMTKIDVPDKYKFTRNNKDTYYERSFVCPQCEWKWHWGIANEAISHNNPIKLYGVTEQECMTACEETQDFLCKSVDWKFTTNKCFVTKVFRADTPEHWTSWPPYKYHQRQLRCDCDPVWSSPRVKGYRQEAGREESQQSAASLEECKNTCDSSEDFECMAVTWIEGSNDCLLYDRNREHTPGSYEKTYSNVYYAEKDTMCPACDWEFRMTIKNEGVPTLKTFTKLTLLSCRSLCKTEEDFFCKSVVYNEETKACELSDVGRRDVPGDVVSRPGFRLHERLVDC